MNFNQTLRDIKNLKVQGAENIAKCAVCALADVSCRGLIKSKKQFFSNLLHHKQLLANTRPTEPLMRNMLNLLVDIMGNSVTELKTKLIHNRDQLISRLQVNQELIAKSGAKLIKEGMIIYTHCHSSTVMGILKQAKMSGKKFVVHNTETRPGFQGRLSAKELAESKIKVVYFVDAAFVEAIKDSNLILLGADAITKKGVYNKVGTKTVVVLAAKYNIPVYICSDSLKFDSHTEVIEQRDPSEVWENAPKGVMIKYPAFELINPEEVTAIISELGILNHEVFIEKVKHVR